MRGSLSLVLAFLVSVGFVGGAAAATAVPTVTPTETPSLVPGEIRFEPGLRHIVPAAVVSMAIADFNLDELPDLAVASLQAKRVSILLGDGLGEFSTILPSDTFGSGPLSIAAADLNGDTYPDVAVAAPNADSFIVLLGRGDGSLGPATVFRAGSSPTAIVTGDFDGQLGDDIAVSNLGDGTVSFFFNRGTRALAFSPASSFPSRAPFLLQAADFDGDGALDAAAINLPGVIGGNDVTPLLGNGLGGFRALQSVAAGIDVKGSTLGDFNNDGLPDIAVTNSSSPDSKVSLLLADGTGSFTQFPQTQVNCFAVGTGRCLIGPVAAGDFDSDGNLDLVIAATNANGFLFFFLGNGDGTLTPFGRAIDLNGAPGAMIAGDFDLDGRVDIAIGSGPFVQILHNVTEMITPIPATSTPTPTPTPTLNLTPGTPGTPGGTPRKGNGEQCGDGVECASNICSQNRCCDRVCDGVTERCDLNPPGICQANFTPKPTVTQSVLHVGSSGGCSTGGSERSSAGQWASIWLPAALWLGRRRLAANRVARCRGR